ncbi:DUF4007 family protein (plasmid) [Aquicoccus sp. G2-2]|uniref:DUF4007 family protein n=1 Tax=Aquicoccus sp. G2-2 TaxID=3092120 RepID=UPI002AE0A636|nr:DUF4007 family protein [Aquicoccus sp. G2-2]MEA1111963.1 DUF4007 family protein [Aquicoccus sp. G2-2]
MTVFFHGNFALDRPRMAQLLMLALANPKYSDKDLAKPFGYGAPFAAIYRSWLHKCGIANLRRPVTLTDLGKVVFEHDPNLSTMPTLWFLHHQLTREPDRAEAWHFFIHKFRPSHENFTEEDLRKGLIVQLSPHDMKHFGEESTMVPIITKKILECYTSEDSLGPLDLVRETGRGEFAFSNTEIPLPRLDIQSLATDFA